MRDEGQLNVIEELCEKLEVSQELIEKAAFDTINQQDKIAQLMNSSMTCVMELLSKLEMVGMELESTFEENVNATNLPIQKINHMLSNQYSVMEQIAQIYQSMIEEQTQLSEVLHNMESEIACHRDSVELAEELLLQQG